MLALWALCEIAICACDLAEVIGGAIALNLLLGAPLVLGVCVMAGDALLILLLERRGFRQIEAVAIALSEARKSGAKIPKKESSKKS